MAAFLILNIYLSFVIANEIVLSVAIECKGNHLHSEQLIATETYSLIFLL